MKPSSITKALRCEDRTDVERQIDEAIGNLRAALDGADAEKVCERSRSLSALADYAFKCPGAWSEARSAATLDLLKAAASKTRKREPIGSKCAARPDRFARRVKCLLAAREAFERLLSETESGSLNH